MTDLTLKSFFVSAIKCVLTITLLVVGFSWQSVQAKSPNVLIILADDMGYGDIQAYQTASKIPTPHLNRLAESGIHFTDAHTPSSVCTPTRYGLLTGEYCWRTRLKSGVLNGYSEPLIERETVTIAEFLQQQGYQTGIVGKWHLGLGFTNTPTGFDFHQPVNDSPKNHGFADSLIIPASLDFPPYVYIRNGNMTAYPGIEQQAQKFPPFLRKGERAADLIMENVLDDLAHATGQFLQDAARKEQPWFLYVPLTAPHKPVLPHPRYRGKTDLGPYGDFVHQVDQTVGTILSQLEATGQAENTLVIYTSDNGSFMYRIDNDKPDHLDDATVQGFHAAAHSANGLLRGTKADIWEAGHRVPFLVRWPAQILPGRICEQTVCLTDIFATLAELVNNPVPAGVAADSFSFAGLLQGKTEFVRAPVIHHSVSGMFAIREGDWKLVAGNGSGGREAPKGKPFEKPYQLYNLKSDLSETNNMIEAKPDIARRLEDKLLKIRDSGSSKG